MTTASRVKVEKWKPVRVEKVNNLYDMLAAAPDGLYGADIAEGLEVTISTARRVVRDLRVTLGVDDVITVITEQQGSSAEPCLYKLVGTFREASESVTRGVGTVETRAETLWYQVAPLARASDGRTSEGRRARFIEETLRHMMATLALMREGQPDEPTLFEM